MTKAITPAGALKPGTIKIEDVSLDFPIYEHIVKDRLKEILGTIIPSIRPRRKAILKSISLSIEPGEIIGLVGINGAGKTTLLKIIAELIRPQQGTVCTGGKVMALLAMGMGFRPVLTGRENAYYGGLLLGMKKNEVDKVIGDIQEFSGLQDSFDQPYFTYSSGMQARLGFALATSVKADIIILDETLATGDRRFIARCYRRIKELCESGKTIIFVSHNLGEIARMTSRVVLLNEGRVAFDGPTGAGLAMFDKILLKRNVNKPEARFTDLDVDIDMYDADGKQAHAIHVGAPCSIKLTIQSEKDLGPSYITVFLINEETNQLITYLIPGRQDSFLNNFDEIDNNIDIKTGTNTITWEIEQWLAGEGTLRADIYVGPKVSPRKVDISDGRTWQKIALFETIYGNPYLRGAGTAFELAVKSLLVSHEKK